MRTILSRLFRVTVMGSLFFIVYNELIRFGMKSSCGYLYCGRGLAAFI